MDTKLKSSKVGKVIISLIAVMLVAITSIGMISSYPMIDKIAKEREEQYSYFEGWEFTNVMNGYRYKAFYDILQKKSDKALTPYEALVKGNAYQHEKDDFNDMVSTYTTRYSNLEYFAVDTKDRSSTTNMDTEIKVLENGEIDINSINLDDYQFYVAINYNELGRPSIKTVNGANEYNIQPDLDYNFNGYDAELVPITNTNFLFAVPKELKYHDNIFWNISNAKNEHYGSGAAVFVVIGVIFIILSALLIPYNKAREIIGFKTISKIPLEIVCVLVGLNVFLTVAASLYMVSECITGIPGTFIGGVTGNVYLGPNAYYLINLSIWVIIFTVYFNVGLILKHIFKIGLKKYFITTTLIGMFFGFIVRYIKKTIKALLEVDLSEKNNKVIFKVVLINAAILSLLCLVWFFGVIGIMIYSVVIFFVIRKYADEISSKYKILTDATKKIAEGNLDVTIEEDLGLFEPLKDDLERIQSGFKKAVKEEVKSQKMKTELISNVSHDLKTPLTSIITYVDLLKDENLPQEKRVQYLDTLDRKSQRLQYLIEDLFEVSKASSGNITLNIEAVDVVSLMKQTLLELEDKLNASSLVVRKNFPEEKVTLQLDSFRTFRVFENLVSNITKYAMPNTRVYIDIVDNNETVEIVLKNMAAEEINFDVEQIVERFVRGDESRNTEGSGLGLAIAKSFVELQGGSFKIEVDGDLFKVIITVNK